MTRKEIRSMIPALIAILHEYPSFDKKIENMRKNIRKENLEKIFWQRKCKFYAPNKMEDHYQELDEELKKAGLFVEKGGEE